MLRGECGRCELKCLYGREDAGWFLFCHVCVCRSSHDHVGCDIVCQIRSNNQLVEIYWKYSAR
jgi:hypothetical protein